MSEDGENEIDTNYLPKNFDYKKDYVVRCLNANKHNHITTSYYLLLKKYQSQGESAKHPIRQADFKVFDEKAVNQLIQAQRNQEKGQESQRSNKRERKYSLAKKSIESEADVVASKNPSQDSRRKSA